LALACVQWGPASQDWKKEPYIWKTQPTFGFANKQEIVEIF
jgi:hypothetical protein